ncbi:MAG: hypothetical protein RL490_1495, partial [Pseudomonadota bacterium]
MIGLPFIYTVAGAVFAAWAVLTLADRAQPRRFASAGFWALLALSFLAGDRLGDTGNGVLVLALVAIGGFGLIGRANPATASADDRIASAA